MLALVAALLATVTAVTGVVTHDQKDNHVWYGVHTNEADRASYAAFASQFSPAPTVVSMFVKLDSPEASVRSRLELIFGRGQTPFITLETWSYKTPPGTINDPALALAPIAAGRDDLIIRKLAAIIASYRKPVYVRPMHEFNGHWFPWSVSQNGNTPADYVAAWKRLHRLFADQPYANVRWVWAPNVVQQVHGDVSLADTYPGDDQVDYVGFTGYARNAGETPSFTFDKTITALGKVTRKPVIIAETGASGPTKDQWLAQLGDWLAAHDRVRGIVYFNTTAASTGASGEYAITSAGAASALQGTLTQSVAPSVVAAP
jgi:mannan endo-1,4-beta-mannosidase